jgi:aminoglycoside phosphotransferase (APT) family kinase protein
MSTDDQQRTDALTSWICELTNETSVSLTRRPGGGRHQAWDVDGASGEAWFLRADAEPPGAHEHYTLRREAEIYRAVHAIGLPSPAVIGVHPHLEAVLLERAEGVAAFARLDETSKTSIIDDMTPWLAKLHAANPDDFEMPSIATASTIVESVHGELDIWESRLEMSGIPDPILTACFMWLRDNVPDTGSEPPCIVQADTGPGNFLHDGTKVTAFLDFELGHLGDPMEDIAWVGTRNSQEPVPDFERFIQHYAAATGTEPDRDRIRYHEFFAELRIAVLGTERTGNFNLDAEHGNRLIYGALHRRLTVEALAGAMGVPMPEVELSDLVDSDDTFFFDAALHQMRHTIGPHVADPYAARLHKGLARVLKYLREVDRSGGRHEQAELDDLEALLGHRPDLIATGSAELLDRVRKREISAEDLLAYAAGQVARQTQLVGPAMGVLATRHLPDV